MQRRALGQRGALVALGAAVTVVAGTFTALQLTPAAMLNAPEAAESLPVELSPAGIETPTLAVAAAVLAGAVPVKETPASAPSAATAAEPRPTGETKAPAPALSALPFYPPALNADDAGREINPAAASTALSVAASSARSCLEADDPRTTMEVRVTFAPSGRVTTAMVSRGPFAGTEVGGCIARALRSAKVGPFEGPPVTVSRSIRIR